MHSLRLDTTWLQTRQWLRLGHLIYDDLVLPQRLLRDPVPGLDHGRFGRDSGCLHTRRARKETPDRYGIRGIVSALVDYFKHVVGAQNRRRHLDPAGSPAVR